MKVLITGGYGFIGSHVAERFYKEGHQLFIIDNLVTGSKNNLNIKHNFYNLNIADKKCEEIFRTNNIDVVVHLAAQVDVSLSVRDPVLDSESNILGLVNILNLSRKYGVKKVMFASSAAVYGNSQDFPLAETVPVQPISVYGINKSVGENYCQRWKELYGLDTVIMRFANVYGPRQGAKGEAGVISVFMKNMQEGKELVIYGDGNQTRDYIYVEDVADAIYKAVSSTVQCGLMNISANMEYSLNDLLNELSQTGDIKGIRYEERRKGDIDQSRLDNSRAKQELGWSPKYTLAEGLTKTYKWYEHDWNSNKTIAATVETGNNQLKSIKPYIENFVLFAIIVALNISNIHAGYINFSLGLDYNYIYIAAMGILYGKQQSLLATALSTIILINAFLIRGADLVAIVYQPQYLVHFATYLFIAIITGYISDNRERISVDLNLELEHLQERYQFLEKMYLECSQIKNELYTQIVNSSNSIGKTYNIIQELDSLEIENIYTAANTIVAETMKTSAVAIYTVSKDRSYLRQKTKTSAKLNDLPKSLKIGDYEYLKQMMATKKVFSNRDLRPEYPNMAAPIVYDNMVIAIVQLYDLPFESLTFCNENLLKITVMLISDALTKAYLYEQGIQEKKYIKSTRILFPDEFEKVQAEIGKRSQTYDPEMPAVLLRIGVTTADYNSVYQGLASAIRAEDYIGLKRDGNIYVLLVNITSGMIPEVQERIKKAGFDSVHVLG